MVIQFQKIDAANVSLSEDGDEEDYIDMELCSLPSPQAQSREFEFQLMPTTSHHTQTTTSPADDLFYEGKLLPLYLLHHHPATAPGTSNISPSESCRVSCDLNSDDYFFEWSNELNTFINNHSTKTTWAKKLKLFKHSILAHHKLKASKAYLKSLFVKSACSNDSSAKLEASAFKNNAARKPLQYPTIAAIMNSVEREGVEENNNAQRRSFSSAIKRHSPTKCLSSSSSNSNSSSGSSSFSLNSNGLQLHEQLHCLRRSSSATEIEGSIEAAIAHCKSSQQVFQSGI